MRQPRRWIWWAAGLLGLSALAVAVYYLPPVHSRLSWRVAGAWSQFQQWLNPPARQVFVPQEAAATLPSAVVTLPTAVVTIIPPAATPTARTSPTPGPTATASPAPSPTATLPPPPAQWTLTGVRHEYQTFNNCGPATLSMLLNFWGWEGDQLSARAVLRPGFETVDDKNTSPEEMVAFVETETDLRALLRVNGDLTLLKRLIAAGFPVIIERGLQLPEEEWEGHYTLLTGYDDAQAHFITQDALILPNLPVPYAELETAWWRDFNRLYLVVYPPEREADVLSLLGPDAASRDNYQRAAETAAREAQTLTGPAQYFAYYNLGSSRLGLEDFAAAARAYDAAFQLYPTLPEAVRPWRMLWYQPGPYQAYFRMGRYRDVINLATTTLSTTTSPGLPGMEEAFYWRALAYLATDQRERGLAGLRDALTAHPGYPPALTELQRLGEKP